MNVHCKDIWLDIAKTLHGFPLNPGNILLNILAISLKDIARKFGIFLQYPAVDIWRDVQC
ncbi:uncharacterized protein LAESUDRAFT_720930, partial [Laetiporus sulphureus 93-53]